MKLYVVLVETYIGNYGTAMVLAGIFKTREDAEKAARKIHEQTEHSLNGWIHEVEADKLYSFETNSHDYSIEGDIPDEAISTGWYIE